MDAGQQIFEAKRVRSSGPMFSRKKIYEFIVILFLFAAASGQGQPNPSATSAPGVERPLACGPMNWEPWWHRHILELCVWMGLAFGAGASVVLAGAWLVCKTELNQIEHRDLEDNPRDP